MAAGLIQHYEGVRIDEYDALLEHLAIYGEQGWPHGLLAHIDGSSSAGVHVTEVWETEDAFETFLQQRLRPAFEVLGNIPEPVVTRFEAHGVHVRHV